MNKQTPTSAMSRGLSHVVSLCLAAVHGLVFVNAANAWTSYPPPTLSDILADNDLVVVGRAMRVASNTDGGVQAQFHIERVLSQSRGTRPPRQIEAGGYRPVQARATYLLYSKWNKRRTELLTSIGPPFTDRHVEYLLRAPTRGSAVRTQLTYFLPFLEHRDSLISSDAVAECARCVEESPNVLPRIVGQLPVERVRNALRRQSKLPHRSLYALLLGLHGRESAERFLREMITAANAKDYDHGLDGAIAGYMIASGEDALMRIEQSHLGNVDAPIPHAYAAYTALCTVWKLELARFPQARLRVAMRRLLDDPRLADLAIVKLADWQDWTVHDRVLGLCQSVADEETRANIRRCAVVYLIAGMQIGGPNGPTVEQATMAHDHYDQLRRSDPQFVRRATRSVELLRGFQVPDRPGVPSTNGTPPE